MRSLWRDERGLTVAYLTVIITVIFCSLLWICLNEFVLRVGNLAITWNTDPSSNIPLILFLWRMLPIVILLGCVIWAIWTSMRERSGVYG